MAGAMAAAILEVWASELVDAAATAATAAATLTTDTMACTWALSARSFSLLLCFDEFDRLTSLCWNHLPMDWWWLRLLMELLLASVCRKIQKYDKTRNEKIQKKKKRE